MEVLTASMSVAVCAPGLTTQDNKLLSPSPSLSLSLIVVPDSPPTARSISPLSPVVVTATGLRTVIWVTGLKDEGCPGRPDVTSRGNFTVSTRNSTSSSSGDDGSRGVRWVGGPPPENLRKDQEGQQVLFGKKVVCKKEKINRVVLKRRNVVCSTLNYIRILFSKGWVRVHHLLDT